MSDLPTREQLLKSIGEMVDRSIFKYGTIGPAEKKLAIKQVLFTFCNGNAVYTQQLYDAIYGQ